MVTLETQQELFRLLKGLIPSNLSFVDEIAELLNISNDSAYRRIRGEKPLTFDEIHILCSKYHLSLDKLMNLSSDSIVFSGANIDIDHFDFNFYLNDLLNNMRTISQAREKMVYYEAKDIPLFYHFHYPDLAAFKYFFWMKTILCHTPYGKMQFEDNELTGIIQKPGAEIIKLYNTIPSTEIWSVETINSILKQIEFYKLSGVFKKKETVEKLLHDLSLVVDHIKEQAERGRKFCPGETPAGDETNFSLFSNEVILGKNSVVVETDGHVTVFINHNVLNYMITRDPAFCEYTRKCLNNSMKKSILISAVGEKDRNIFFNSLQEHIAATKARLL